MKEENEFGHIGLIGCSGVEWSGEVRRGTCKYHLLGWRVKEENKLWILDILDISDILNIPDIPDISYI